MNFKRKVKFLNQCTENINKVGFYIDLSDKEISFGPCLILKKYYKWTLKYIYKLEVLEEECEKYFLNVIEKLDYKVVANMEYIDFRDLLLAYFSLGEIYYNDKNFEKSKEYFLKVIDMMEQSLKVGNKYQTEEVGTVGVVLFEILMWARKNLGDMEEGSEALELYESIIGEEECLYIEKNYSIFKTAKALNMVAVANDAARGVMKIDSTYKGVNVEVVDYLIKVQDYENALDIATEEYIKNDITHWINIVNVICRDDKELNIECVNKVINFMDILIKDLKVVEWSTTAYTLYMKVREVKETQLQVLNYLRECFNKIKKNDFSACGQAIVVLKNIYEDIRLEKYNKEYLRDYEFDFTLYLMNTAVLNESFEKGLECAAKLESIIEVKNINKDIYPYVNQCLAICEKKVTKEKYDLDSYPWNYLYDNLKELYSEYGIEERIKSIDIARNSSRNLIIGINNLEDERTEAIINEAVGERIFHKNKDIVFVSGEAMEVDKCISDVYSSEVIVKEGILKDNCCIITYENACISRLADINVIIVDGHKELRDMDITYIRHLLKESLNNKILILINSKLEGFSEGTVSYDKTIINTLLDFNNIEVIDISDFSSNKEIIGAIIGDIPESIIKHKFEMFNNDVKDALDSVKEDIKNIKASFKERRYVVSECSNEYSYIEEELNNNHKEFSAKVNNDIEFLRKYAGEKISAAIPDLLQVRFSAIDDLDDFGSIKEKSEGILSKAVASWCSKNIYRLMLEQFQVYIAKYSKYYRFHEETIERIAENRKTLIDFHPEFEKSMIDLEVKSLEEVIQEILISYESYLKEINYRVNIIPSGNIFSNVKDGIKTLFLKDDEKAENLRMKIKGSVIENIDNISNLLINNIDEKLNSLQNKLQEIITDIFKGAKESIIKEKAMVDGAIKEIDDEYSLIESKNVVVEAKMEFVEIEALKYSKEVKAGVVYSSDKCYSLN